MDASSRIAAGSDTLYGPPCGRTVTVPSADALMARERQVPEACDALALSGGLLGSRGLLPSTVARRVLLECPSGSHGRCWPHHAHRLGDGSCVFCHNREGQELAIADDQQGCRSPDLLFNEEAVQVIDARHRPPRVPHQHIARAHAHPLCRAVWLYSDDEHATGRCQTMAAHQRAPERHILPGNAQRAALDAAVFDEPAGYKRGGIDADGKADPL